MNKQLIYAHLKSLCIAYGKTNIGITGLSNHHNISQAEVSTILKELIADGWLEVSYGPNHFQPHQMSIGYSGDRPHASTTRYLRCTV